MSKTARPHKHIRLKAIALMLSATTLALSGCGKSREEELTEELAKAKAEAEQAKTAQKRAEQEAEEAQAALTSPRTIFAEDDPEFEDDEDDEDTEDSEDTENKEDEEARPRDEDNRRYSARNDSAESAPFADRRHVSLKPIE